MTRYKKYEAVAISEGAIKKAKEWAADKSGLNNIKSAAGKTGVINSHLDQAQEYENDEKRYTDARDTDLKMSDDAWKNDDVESYSKHFSSSVSNAVGAALSKTWASAHRESAKNLTKERDELRDSGMKRMRRFGATTGSLAGAALGAAAGKGYSVYKRHQMKKRGAKKKALEAHKKNDTSRMLAGAAIGGLVGIGGGGAIGGTVAKRIYRHAGGED